MDFIKKHLVSLLCGVAGLIFIGLTFWGMFQTGAVEEMNQRKNKSNEIANYSARPVNQSIIDAEKKRGAMFEAEYKATIEVAERINKREPLVAGVFPSSKDMTAPEMFRDQYNAAIRRLPVTLSAGGLPDAIAIAEVEEDVRALIAMEAELKEGDGKKPSDAAPELPPPAAFAREAPAFIGEGGPRGMGMFSEGMRFGGGGISGGSPLVPSGPPKYDARFRAHVNRAKSILCYAEQWAFHVSSLSKAINLSSDDNTFASMWTAQVSLWVQQDVVNAIAAMNAAAAGLVKVGDPHVEHTPVKRIERIRVHGYQLKEGKFYPFDEVGAVEGISREQVAPAESFTGKAADDQFDVVSFTVIVVCDQREMMHVVDAITRANFYQCINLEYRSLTEQELVEGYIYGTAPVVRVRMDFEGYMARAIYAKWMPKLIKEALGVPLDHPPSTEGGG